MATKKECDRCGVLVGEHAADKWKRVKIDPARPINEYDTDGRYEICGPCGDQLKEFLKRIPEEAKRG